MRIKLRAVLVEGSVSNVAFEDLSLVMEEDAIRKVTTPVPVEGGVAGGALPMSAGSSFPGFVNFMMEPEHAAMVSDFARYANGVLGSEKFMDPELLEAPEIVIPEGAPDPEFVPPCEDQVIRLYDRIWTNLLR